MGRPDPINKVVPLWLTVLVSTLPAGGTTVVFMVLFVLDVHPKLFNLSPKDSFVVLGLGLILVSMILALLILCIALTRALQRALRKG